MLFAIGFGDFSQWCATGNHGCVRTVLDQMIPYVTYPFYFFSLYFLPAAILLIFVSRDIFKSWLRLAVWVFPLAFIYIASTPINWTGIGLDLYPFVRDDAARLAGGVITAASLTLVIWEYVAARRGSKRLN